MKNLIIFGIFIIAMVLVQFAQAQTADELIDNYLAAMGGKEKLLTLKSYRKEGSLSVQGTDVTIVITKLDGVGARKDIAVMGMQNYQIVTPTAGTVFMPIMGQTAPEAMPEDQFKTEQNELDTKDVFLNYKDNGIIVKTEGKQKIDDTECNKLVVTFKNGATAQFYFDAKTHYLFRTISSQKVNGEVSEIFTTYTNYKQNADGYWFAYTNTNNRGETNFDKIETNLKIDPSIFK
jgi:hypothetical protein